MKRLKIIENYPRNKRRKEGLIPNMQLGCEFDVLMMEECHFNTKDIYVLTRRKHHQAIRRRLLVGKELDYTLTPKRND